MNAHEDPASHLCAGFWWKFSPREVQTTQTWGFVQDPHRRGWVQDEGQHRWPTSLDSAVSLVSHEQMENGSELALG